MAHSNISATASVIVSIVAGIEIIIVSFILAIIGEGLTSSTQGGIGAVFGIIGIAWGILIITSAYMMHVRKEKHVFWGILIVVFSIASIFGAIGGIFIGLILGVIGGALGIISSPIKRNSKESAEEVAKTG